MARAILFATILIDFVGFSILLPVLPTYLQRQGYSGGEVGLILALYVIGLVIFLPFWGWISDRVGRRPVILLCLLGTSASFAGLVVAASLAAFCVARLLGGFFGASVGTAQAYVTDITDEEGRAHGLALLGGAAGGGMVLGPALGGILGGIHELLPIYVPALLALGNAVLAAFFLPESRRDTIRPARSQPILPALIPTPLLLLLRAHDNRTRTYLYLFFHIFAAFAALEAMFPLYARAALGWGVLETGLFLGYLGLAMGLTQGLAVGRATAAVGEVPLVVVGLALSGTCLLTLAAARSTPALALLGLGVALGNGLYLPTFTSLFSKHCGEETRSGEYLAQSQSMLNTGRGVGFLWGGWALERLGLTAPFVLGGIGILLALGIFAVGVRYLVPRPSLTSGHRETPEIRYSPVSRGGGAKEPRRSQ
ncbi:MAG: MFS transporter [Myxococcota bacterium]